MELNTLHKYFIHTMSMERSLGQVEFEKIKKEYEVTYISENKIFLLTEYIGRGVKIEFENMDRQSRRYDPEHRAIKCRIILNLYRLIQSDCKMGAVVEEDDLKNCIVNLSKIITEIYHRTQVGLLDDIKIKRIDVTHDVVTPSDTYTREIIRLARMSLDRTGYRLWTPSTEDVIRTGWKKENSAMFNSHAKEVECKIYNKRDDLEISDLEELEIGENGLVRFELTLKRNFLLQNLYMNKKISDYKSLLEVILAVTKDAKELMLDYLAYAMRDGEHFSERMLIKYIYRTKSLWGKHSLKEKMVEFAASVNDTTGKGPVWGSRKQIKNVEENFTKIGVSPIVTKKIDYIPSFRNLILDRTDPEKEKFVEKELYKKKR